MATANYTAALNEIADTHAAQLARMTDEQLLELDPSSPLEFELMFRLGMLQELLETSHHQVDALTDQMAAQGGMQ